MKKEDKKQSPFLNLGINILAPVLILSKFSGEDRLGPFYALIVALAFPLVYGLYDLLVQKQKNFVSILGFISILLTGVIGLLKFPPEWIAVKEAMIPFLIGLAILVTIKSRFPLARKIIYNKEILDINSIDNILKASGKETALDKVISKASVFLSLTFFFSAILNYVLAKILVQSPAGTLAFNEELSQMTLLSFPVIAVPSGIIMFLVLRFIMNSIKKLTNLSQNEILAPQLRGEGK